MSKQETFSSKAAKMTNSEIVIWLTTTSRDLSPQPRPVWFLWYEEQFLIYSRATTHKIHHIQERPKVALNFNSDREADEDVVIFKGVARLAPEVPAADQLDAYVEKYKEGMQGIGMTPKEFAEAYNTPILVTIDELEGMV
jgi:PPOX class probable F420-dependent enzyme